MAKGRKFSAAVRKAMNHPSPHPLGGSPLGSHTDEQSTAWAVREMFTAVAPRYDLLNHLLSLRRDVAWRKAAARALREALGQSGSLAVDVCCGTGDLALALARYSSGTVIATDFCRPMLERARHKARDESRPVLFVETDTLRLPFRDRSLDVVGVGFGFRNLANYANGLQELHRVLRPWGILAILEFSRVRWPVFGPLFRFYFQYFLPRLGSFISGVPGAYQYLQQSVVQFPDQESLAAAMREAGFVNVRYHNFTGGVAALHLGYKA